MMSAGVAAQGEIIPDAELKRRLAQQQEDTQSKAASNPQVFTPVKEAGGKFVLPQEAQCFALSGVIFLGNEDFSWLAPEGALLAGKCVGAKGLRVFQDHVTRLFIERGLITTRVLIPQQNLIEGRLRVQIVPGRISAVRDQGTPAGSYKMALPGKPGDLLNQRDLDQALENIRRVSSQQNVEFDLVPGSNPGETEIVIKHPEVRKWHLLGTLDNSGSESTGKYQVGAVVTLDSPLGLYDTLTLTINNNANVGSSTQGTHADSINWSMPYGYWALLAGLNRSSYKQTVAGFNGGIVYGGRSAGAEVGVAYVPYRSSAAKTSVQLKLNRKSNRSNIDDAEVTVQRRDVAGYELSVSHRQFMGRTTVDGGLAVKGSLPSLSPHPGLIIGEPDWDGRYRTETVTAGVSAPLELSGKTLRAQSRFTMQRASTLLPNTEFFSIGNRYTVRGFDGVSTLSAESGWMLRNDLSWAVPNSACEIYAGLDTGRVSGPTAATLLGHALTGTAFGVRGRFSRFTYDFTVGRPIQMPNGFRTKQPTFTASATAEY